MIKSFIHPQLMLFDSARMSTMLFLNGLWEKSCMTVSYQATKGSSRLTAFFEKKKTKKESEE